MKFFATFGTVHLQDFKVNSMQVMLGIEGASENMLRAVLREEPFNNAFFTTYPIKKAKKMKEEYSMKIYTLKELMEKYQGDENV